MANDDIAPPYSKPAYSKPDFATPIAAIAFFGFLLLVFVGLRPFSPPPQVAHISDILQNAAGDSLRQILYLLVLAMLAATAFWRRGLATLQSVPPILALLLGWCLLSALWADAPSVAFRRAGLEVVVVLCAMLSVEMLGAERCFRYWRIVLGTILIVNWLSIPLIRTAVHLPGEIDPALVGDWRGLYDHKNIAGAVCVLTILLFLFSRNGKHNWLGIVMAALALGFLAMTHSKTSLGFLPVALAAGALYEFAWRRGLDRAIASVGVCLILAAGIIFVLLNQNTIAHMLSDPTEFTGRAAIWTAELRYIHDHLLLGAGFGTFSDTGDLSPLHNYVSGRWVDAVSHGHNGYLQLFVTIGGIGFALAMASLILLPLIRFWPLNSDSGIRRGLLFAIFIFLVLHNIMESDFLESDGATWVAFLFMLAAQRQDRKRLTSFALHSPP